MPRVIGNAGRGLRRDHATTRSGIGRGGLLGHIVQEQRFDGAAGRGQTGRAVFDFRMHDGGRVRAELTLPAPSPLWGIALRAREEGTGFSFRQK